MSRLPLIAVVVSGGAPPDLSQQTLQDYELLCGIGEAEALRASRAEMFLWMEGGVGLRPQTLEECVWGLQDADWVTWRDTGAAPPPSLKQCAGPLGVSREAMSWPEPKKSGAVLRLPWSCRVRQGALGPRLPPPAGPGDRPVEDLDERTRIGGFLHYLDERDLLSGKLRSPHEALTRLLPLRWKEAVNQRAGQDVFALEFERSRRPGSAVVGGRLIERLEYATPPKDSRTRVMMFPAALGRGATELGLLEAAREFRRNDCEVLIVATDEGRAELKEDWLEAADYVVDAAKTVPSARAASMVYSMALNWAPDVLAIQGSWTAYELLPAIRERLPNVRVFDILDAMDEEWELFSSALDSDQAIDRRVVHGEAARSRLIDMAVPEDHVRNIALGVDLGRFNALRYDREKIRRSLRLPGNVFTMAFFGRLEEKERPLALLRTAAELETMGVEAVFLVWGAGELDQRLRARIKDRGLTARFRVLGDATDPAEILAAADAVIVPSVRESVPKAVMAAMAMGRPVLACRSDFLQTELPPDAATLAEPGPGFELRLAEGIAEWVQNRARAAEMGKQAQRIAEERYSIDKMRAAYRNFVQEVLNLG